MEGGGIVMAAGDKKYKIDKRTNVINPRASRRNKIRTLMLEIISTFELGDIELESWAEFLRLNDVFQSAKETISQRSKPIPTLDEIRREAKKIRDSRIEPFED
jgi:hypothetical protein